MPNKEENTSRTGNRGTLGAVSKSLSPSELKGHLERTQAKLHQTEMLLSVTRRIAGLRNLSEILWTLIDMTTQELKADRGSLFLNDPLTGELYSRVAQGELTREIRILNTTGIAGSIFQSGVGEIIHNAYDDERFNSKIDEQTGYVTKNVVCAPVRTVRNDIIGVIQILNKKKGRFTKEDLEVVEAITGQAAVSLQNAQGLEEMEKTREKEMQFLDVVSDVTAEIDLGSLLQRVMLESTRMLNADRATLFLNEAGDSSDNVPGVPGIGVKTAAELINKYGNLEKLLKSANEIKQNNKYRISKVFKCCFC